MSLGSSLFLFNIFLFLLSFRTNEAWLVPCVMRKPFDATMIADYMLPRKDFSFAAAHTIPPLLNRNDNQKRDFGRTMFHKTSKYNKFTNHWQSNSFINFTAKNTDVKVVAWCSRSKP